MSQHDSLSVKKILCLNEGYIRNDCLIFTLLLYVQNVKAHYIFNYDVENPLGKKTYSGYNARGERTRTWGDTDYPVEQEYDGYGRMTTLKTYRSGTGWNGSGWPADPDTADITTWNYQESTGLLLSKIYADGKGTAYTYTPDGTLLTRTWARQSGGQPLVTTYTNDPKTGELLSIDYSDATPDIAYTYSRTGQKKTVTDAVGTHTFAYNILMDLASESVSGVYSKTIARDYETSGVPGRDRGFHIGTEYSVQYGYDARGRFQSVNDGTDTFSYSYTASSDLLGTTTYLHGITVSRSYEPHRDLQTSVENRFGATLISGYAYLNDPSGRRTQVVNTGTAFTQSNFIRWMYDDRSEVTGAGKYLGTDPEDTSNPVVPYNYGFNYDNIGNRLTSDSSESGSSIQTAYQSGNLNQYTQIQRNGDPAINPLYDFDGNMTFVPGSEGNWDLVWNAENRLATATRTNEMQLKFSYDYLGRRFRKQVSTWDTDHWVLAKDIIYIYDKWNLIETLDAMNGNAVTKKFAWGLDLSQTIQGAGGVGGLLSMDNGTGKFYYCYDANGNVTQLLDSNGTIAAHYEYSPFGKSVVATGTMAEENEFRFSTKPLDKETGLIYYIFREYNPEQGRWIARDPIGEDGGWNLFGFINNNSTKYFDLLGFKAPPPHEWPKGDRCKQNFDERCQIPFPPDEPPTKTEPVDEGCTLGDIEDNVYGGNWRQRCICIPDTSRSKFVPATMRYQCQKNSVGTEWIAIGTVKFNCGDGWSTDTNYLDYKRRNKRIKYK